MGFASYPPAIKHGKSMWENHRTRSLARSQHEHRGIFPNNGDYFTDLESLEIDGHLYFPQFQTPNYFQKPWVTMVFRKSQERDHKNGMTPVHDSDFERAPATARIATTRWRRSRPAWSRPLVITQKNRSWSLPLYIYTYINTYYLWTPSTLKRGLFFHRPHIYGIGLYHQLAQVGAAPLLRLEWQWESGRVYPSTVGVV